MSGSQNAKLRLVGGALVLWGTGVIYGWQVMGFSARLPYPQVYSLTVSAAQSPEDPLAVVLTAEINGGIDSAPGLHCQPSRWRLGDGTMVTIYPLCKPFWDGGRLPRRMEFRHAYDAPGEHTVTASYGWLESEPITVTAGGAPETQ